MLTRRHIREVTIQLLYNLCQSDSADDHSPISEDLWSTLLEKEIVLHTKNSRKILIHVLQGRPQALEAFNSPAELFIAHLSTLQDHELSITQLKALLRWEKTFSDEFSLIIKRKNNRKPVVASELSQIFKLNRQLLDNRPALIDKLSQDAGLASRGEQLLSGLRKLHKLSEKILLIEDPSGADEFKEINHLKESYKDIQGLKLESTSLANAVLTELVTIDERLALILDNYNLDRVSQTDLAILRLAAFEILFRDDIPPKVSINEAIELAKVFGTDESASFVNGILDQLYKLTPQPHAS